MAQAPTMMYHMMQAPMMQAPNDASAQNVPHSPSGLLGNLSNEEKMAFPGDFGKTAFAWMALNSVMVAVLTGSTFACYQMPAFKDNCTIDMNASPPEKCVEDDRGGLNLLWPLPFILALLLTFSYLGRTFIIFTPQFTRRMLFRATKVNTEEIVEADGTKKVQVKLRTTLWAWILLATLIGTTIFMTVMSATIIDKRCSRVSREKSEETGTANFFTRNFAWLAHGINSNFGYETFNVRSFINPYYWTILSIVMATIYSFFAMTGAQKKEAKEAYKIAKERGAAAAKRAGASARVAGAAGVAAGSAAYAKSRTGAAALAAGRVARGQARRMPLASGSATRKINSPFSQQALKAKAKQRNPRQKGAVLAAAQKAKADLDAQKMQAGASAVGGAAKATWALPPPEAPPSSPEALPPPEAPPPAKAPPPPHQKGAVLAAAQKAQAILKIQSAQRGRAARAKIEAPPPPAKAPPTSPPTRRTLKRRAISAGIAKQRRAEIRANAAKAAAAKAANAAKAATAIAATSKAASVKNTVAAFNGGRRRQPASARSVSINRPTVASRAQRAPTPGSFEPGRARSRQV
jgi:hypothetical protein